MAGRALVVHAHPEPQSFCTAMFRVAVDDLRSAGWAVETSDLYAMGFNPVASAADFIARSQPDYLVYALEQRQGADAGTLAPDIQAEVDKVRAADLLVIVFPLWWFSVPAMLKGWIDRVFVSGIFYGGRRIYGEGGLRGKRALVGVTLGGREHMFGPGSLHGGLGTEPDAMLRPLLQGTLGYVGCEVLQPYFAWHVPYVDDAARAALLQGWRDALAGQATRAVLPMPDLARFDRQFRPLAGS